MAKVVKGKVTFDKAEARFGYVKGKCKWAKVLEADDYGNFSVSMYGEGIEELQSEFEVLRDLAAEELDEVKKQYNKVDVLKTDNDGNKFIGFKLPENDYEGNPNKITMYDASGKEVKDWDQLVGNDSLVKIKYRVAPYYMSSTKNVGLSYKFYAMQVIDLVEYGGDAGFGDETDGQAPFDDGNGDDF